uniref:cytochrome b n=1 Tax=Tetragonula pagdeni TaxID=270535 RepID=UPI0021821F53|nr:cytochrome b [Tetragonula pagdeni]UVG40755.1 cytochrome b [Tetragonula pagdeni]
MKKFKSLFYLDPMLKITSSFIFTRIHVNINYFWNFGSMLGMFLMIQIVSGLFLSMHYCPSIDSAFYSVSYIMKDVNSGWLIRLIHMNGASFYFIMIYAHIMRGMYYYSFKLTSVWLIGSTITFMSMATAFLGYVLPWGQMSFWGAMVITNLLSAVPYVGNMIVEWLWGGFSINNSTLNRFFSFHFILPFIILFLVILHLFMLHKNGSSNPLNSKIDAYKIVFYPYFMVKDLVTIFLILLLFMIVNLQMPYFLSDPDNFKMADPMVTPLHIKPEWYFLFAYSILRSIPNKLGGVIMLFMSVFILYFLPVLNINNMKSIKFYPFNQFIYWVFINNVIVLTWLGSKPIEHPFVELNILFTSMYFIYYVFSFLLSNLTDLFNYNKR